MGELLLPVALGAVIIGLGVQNMTPSDGRLAWDPSSSAARSYSRHASSLPRGKWAALHWIRRGRSS